MCIGIDQNVFCIHWRAARWQVGLPRYSIEKGRASKWPPDPSVMCMGKRNLIALSGFGPDDAGKSMIINMYREYSTRYAMICIILRRRGLYGVTFGQKLLQNLTSVKSLIEATSARQRKKKEDFGRPVKFKFAIFTSSSIPNVKATLVNLECCLIS